MISLETNLSIEWIILDQNLIGVVKEAEILSKQFKVFFPAHHTNNLWRDFHTIVNGHFIGKAMETCISKNVGIAA